MNFDEWADIMVGEHPKECEDPDCSAQLRSKCHPEGGLDIQYFHHHRGFMLVCHECGDHVLTIEFPRMN